jgi:hypothetical protein
MACRIARQALLTFFQPSAPAISWRVWPARRSSRARRRCYCSAMAFGLVFRRVRRWDFAFLMFCYFRRIF